MTKITGWKIHIEVHKTATTHLQDLLEHSRNQLRAHGIHYITRRESRDSRLVKLLRKEKHNSLLPCALYQKLLDRALRTHTTDIGGQESSILISEENIPGTSKDLLSGAPYIYPQLSNRLGGIKCIVQHTSLEIFIAIRSYDSLLSSAYCQSLRAGWGRSLASPDELAGELSRNPPNWQRFVSMIAREIPKAKLRVWRFEDYVKNPLGILNILSNGAIPSYSAEALSHSPPSSTIRLSRMCVAKILQMDTMQSQKSYKAHLATILQLHEQANSTRFELFGQQEKNTLQEAYRQDVNDIKASLPGVMIEA